MKSLLLRMLVVFFSFGIVAQAQVTTSSINGTITDEATGEGLIGATVVAKHLPTGTVYGDATNTKGNFLLQGLRPGGPYTIEISYIGYQTTTLERITLNLGDTETLNIKLKDATQSLQQVVVVGNRQSSFNASRTGTGTSFSRKSIESTPSVSRSLFDIAKLTPQASGASGGTSFAGSSNKYNSFQIDGTVNNDVFGLNTSGTNGGATDTAPISLEAIEAVQVVIAPFDVRQGGFTGGGINAITKSGSNSFSGSVYDYYYNQDFYGTTAGKDIANRQKIGKQHSNTLGFTLGGRIIKDKLFFFVNGEYVDRSTPSTYYLTDSKSAITEAMAEQVVARLGVLRPGYDGGGYKGMNVPTRNYKALARLDWNISQAHRLSLRYSYVQGSKLAYNPSLTNLVFADRAFSYHNKTHSLVGELNSRFSSAVNNELRVGYTRIRDTRQTNTDFPSIQIKVGGSNINLGADAFAAANQLDQDIYTLTNNLTLTAGNHTFTFGTHNELVRMYNLFIRNFYGSYTYKTLDDFLSGARPEAYNYSYAIESITGSRLWGPSFTAAQLGFYAQDEWKATDNLRLTYGVRADLPIFFDKPRANDYFNSSAIAKQYGVANNTMPKTRILWSPRVGFRYTLDADRRELIRGGIGIFTGRIPFVWISNSFSNTGIEYSRTELRSNYDFAANPGFAFSATPAGQYVNVNAKRPYSEIDMVSKDFRFPQVLRANLAFETTLPGGVKATLEGLYSKTLNNLRYSNLMVHTNGNTLAQGSVERPLYSVVRTNDTNPYTELIYLQNTDKGHTYSLTAQLAKEFDFGLSASIAYTYGQAMASHDAHSSQAASGWRYNYSFAGGNSDEVYYSNFDLRHRIVGNLNYRIEYGKHFATTIGLIYNGQNGSRYTLLYDGDINGDGYRDNDLLYLPTSDEIAGMNFTNPAHRTALESYIASRPELAEYRGKVVPRNGLRMPFVHQFDLHFAQDFFFNVGGRRHTIQLNADIINVGNMIDRGWGLNYSLSNFNYRLIGYNNGAYTFSTPRNPDIYSQTDLSSRWQAQVGLKYIF